MGEIISNSIVITGRDSWVCAPEHILAVQTVSLCCQREDIHVPIHRMPFYPSALCCLPVFLFSHNFGKWRLCFLTKNSFGNVGAREGGRLNITPVVDCDREHASPFTLPSNYFLKFLFYLLCVCERERMCRGLCVEVWGQLLFLFGFWDRLSR